jgi:serine/threonine-protein kinase
MFSLKINSIPQGAVVYQNESYVGTTPFEAKNGSPGSYVFSIKKEGYKEFRQNYTIEENKPLTINARLEQLRGSLNVITNPADAILTIDGKTITGKNTPLMLENLAVGTHELVIKKEGYKTKSKTIDIQPDLTNEINVDLEAALGDLEVQAKPWGTISIDDSLRQEETNLIYTEQLTCQPHRIRVEHPTLGTWEKLVEISPEKVTQIDIDFNQKFSVVVTAFDQDNKPVYANIFVDDKNITEVTPQTIELRLGIHRISVQKEGYILTQGEKTVLVDDNLDEPLKFILKKIIN